MLPKKKVNRNHQKRSAPIKRKHDELRVYFTRFAYLMLTDCNLQKASDELAKLGKPYKITYQGLRSWLKRFPDIEDIIAELPFKTRLSANAPSEQKVERISQIDERLNVLVSEIEKSSSTLPPAMEAMALSLVKKASAIYDDSQNDVYTDPYKSVESMNKIFTSLIALYKEERSFTKLRKAVKTTLFRWFAKHEPVCEYLHNNWMDIEEDIDHDISGMKFEQVDQVAQND